MEQLFIVQRERNMEKRLVLSVDTVSAFTVAAAAALSIFRNSVPALVCVQSEGDGR